MSKLRLFLLACLAILPLACTSIELGRKTLPPGMTTADLKTKKDLLVNLGGPSNVIGRGEEQIWIYTHSLGGGGGFGVGNYAISVLFTNQHRWADTALFLIDADGQVLQSRLLQSTDRVDYSIWPF